MAGDRWKGDLLTLIVGLLVVAGDQFTKFWVMSSVQPGETLYENALFRIIYVTNTGAAFGLFRDRSILFVLIAVAVVALLVIYRRVLSSDALLFRVALGLQLGGAMGNLVDRVRFGHVIDFVDFRWWPVWNVADASILTGVFLLGYFILFCSKDGMISQPQRDGSRSEGDGTL